MSKIEVDKVDPQSGTTLTLGTSGDTVSIPSGVTLANAGTVSGIPASAISSGTIATARLGSGTASSSTFLRGDQSYAAAGGGKVLQVLTDTKLDAYSSSTSAGTFYNPTGFSIAITPAATSSKILVMCSLVISSSDSYEVGSKITKTIGGSTTDVLVGNASNSVVRAMFTRRLNGDRDTQSNTMVVLDSPSTTSEITYKPAIAVEGGVTIYLNQPKGMGTSNGDFLGASQITVMEIGA